MGFGSSIETSGLGFPLLLHLREVFMTVSWRGCPLVDCIDYWIFLFVGPSVGVDYLRICFSFLHVGVWMCFF